MIVTVPLFLLKTGRLKFTPDLPTRKQAAISNLGAGLIEKVDLLMLLPHYLPNIPDIKISDILFWTFFGTLNCVSQKFWTKISDTA